MKAIQFLYYKKPEEYLLHSNVVEVEKRTLNREFKCLCCGVQWTETINSPGILDEDVERNLYKYYPKEEVVLCTKKLRSYGKNN